MSKPIIADNKPHVINLNKGDDYYFCTCGKSAKQPLCDGSHKGTDFIPKKFTAERHGNAYLCHCKHSQSLPLCDGTHQKFSSEMVGKAGPGITPID